MKPRTVIVMLEIKTDAPLLYLKDPDLWESAFMDEAIYGCYVRQVSAQVAQPVKEKKE